MDEDLDGMSGEQLTAVVRKLRAGIREHRDGRESLEGAAPVRAEAPRAVPRAEIVMTPAAAERIERAYRTARLARLGDRIA